MKFKLCYVMLLLLIYQVGQKMRIFDVAITLSSLSQFS